MFFFITINGGGKFFFFFKLTFKHIAVKFLSRQIQQQKLAIAATYKGFNKPDSWFQAKLVLFCRGLLAYCT